MIADSSLKFLRKSLAKYAETGYSTPGKGNTGNGAVNGSIFRLRFPAAYHRIQPGMQVPEHLRIPGIYYTVTNTEYFYCHAF